MARAVEALYEHWEPLTQEAFNNLILDFRQFCSDGSIILDKNGNAVPMKLNEAQLAVADFLIPEIFAEMPAPINLFIHKSRQMGITTVLNKIEQYVATRIRNINMQHVMPSEDDADDIFELKFIPGIQGTHPELIPDTYKTERRLKFTEFGGTPLKSAISFSSAEKKSGGRGGTNQIVIEDEQAYYQRVASLERGLIGTMPKTGRSIRIVVSTANGMNHFADLSKTAQKSNKWKYLFLPWHMLKEYETEPEGRLKNVEALTEYELKLCSIFEKAGYPVESWTRKMQWYMNTMETEANGDQEHMFENYPSTAEESFMASGQPALPSVALAELRDVQVKLEFIEQTEDMMGKIEFKPAILSSIRKLKDPIAGHKYIFAADPADGGADGDDSAGVMIDLNTMEGVLYVKDKLDQNDFAELAVHLAKWYNTATIVVERNTGQSMIDWMVKVLRYPRVFIDPLHTTKSRVQYGVYMTTGMKKEAIYRLKYFLNKRIYKDYDPYFIDDAMYFVWKKTPTGLAKAAASEGHHDDTVMARLIGMLTIDMKKYKDYKSNG